MPGMTHGLCNEMFAEQYQGRIPGELMSASDTSSPPLTKRFCGIEWEHEEQVASRGGLFCCAEDQERARRVALSWSSASSLKKEDPL